MYIPFAEFDHKVNSSQMVLKLMDIHKCSMLTQERSIAYLVVITAG